MFPRYKTRRASHLAVFLPSCRTHMQDGLFSSSAPQSWCKPWLLKSRITTHELSMTPMMAAGVFNNSFDFRKQKVSSNSRSPWAYTTTHPCPGIWSSFAADRKHTISLNFTGYGICQFWPKTNRLILRDYIQNRSQCAWVCRPDGSTLVVPNRRWGTRSFISPAQSPM